MITESYYWKQPLLEMADRLRAAQDREEVTEEEFAQLERDLFIGFYSVRKLFEATAKVSDETRAMTLPLTWYPKRPNQPLVDWYNRSEFWELFDLDDRRREHRDVLFVAGRLIHSFIFVPTAAGESDPDGAFFTSDRDKEERLYFLATADIIELFEAVGNDYPGLVSWRDSQTGEMKWRAPRIPDALTTQSGRREDGV